MTTTDRQPRKCIIEPPSEVHAAAKLLDAAVSAHLNGNTKLAAELLAAADIKAVRDWTESMWGSPKKHRVLPRNPELRVKGKDERIRTRMPNSAEKAALLKRDGFHCRYCDIPVVPKEVRVLLQNHYPSTVTWGDTNREQHAALQAMWLNYDHVVPHSMGGCHSLSNIVITCAPCNYAKSGSTIEELSIESPFKRPPIQSEWDGLTRLLTPR